MHTLCKRHVIVRTAALLSLASLAGCALVYEGKYDWDDGWRNGQVVGTGVGMALPRATSADCRKGVADDVVARTQYAEVRYQTEGRWYRHRIVPVAADVALSKGQPVYINVNSCSDALVKAIELR